MFPLSFILFLSQSPSFISLCPNSTLHSSFPNQQKFVWESKLYRKTKRERIKVKELTEAALALRQKKETFFLNTLKWLYLWLLEVGITQFMAKLYLIFSTDFKNPSVLIEGVLFRARYLGSTQLVCEGQPTKATRMMQAEEAVSRIKVWPRYPYYFCLFHRCSFQFPLNNKVEYIKSI